MDLISLLFVTGAVLGVLLLVLAAIAVVVMIDPGRGERWWAAIFAALALFFVPAVWASVAATTRRQSIQKATTAGCIVLAALGILSFGMGFAVILALPTALLGTAAGLVFQGGAHKR